MGTVSEKKYLDSDTAYNAGTLSDWYISSVDDSDPIWTDAHIDELVNDFYVIPKDTPVVDVAPVVHGHWKYEQDEGHSIYTGECSVCGYRRRIDPFCGRCGAKMDEREDNDNA